MIVSGTHSYERIVKEENSDEDDDSCSFEQDIIPSQRVRQSRVALWLTAINGTLFLCSLALWGWTSTYNDCTRESCSPQKLSAYCRSSPYHFPVASDLPSFQAPLLNKVDVSFIDRTVNGTFWPQDPPSVYQQRPNPSVDAAWERVGNLFPVPLSASEITKTGKNPEECFQFPAGAVNGRDNIYMGMADVFHQIHCLDNFRRAFWSEYYGDLRKALVYVH
jgi:hypothetical protein